MRRLRPGRLALAVMFLLPVTAAAQLWCVDTDALRVEVDATTAALVVHHDGAMYNCCPEPIYYTLNPGDETLFITEHVAADPPCDCNCCYTLRMTWPAPPAGHWWIDFEWWDLESGEWRHLTDEVTIPDVGQDGADDTEAWISDCLESPVTAGTASWGRMKAIFD